MGKAAWKSFLAHKGRLALSVTAVALGVAFLVGALTFTSMLDRAFSSITTSAIPDIDVSAEGRFDNDAAVATQTGSDVDREILEKVAQVPGVASVDGVNTVAGIYALDADGHVVSSNAGITMSIATNWFQAPAYSGRQGIVLVEGNAPVDDAEVALDPDTAEAIGAGIGDSVELITQDGERFTKTVSGTAKWGEGGTLGAQYVFLNDAEMQRLMRSSAAGSSAGSTAESAAGSNAGANQAAAEQAAGAGQVGAETASGTNPNALAASGTTPGDLAAAEQAAAEQATGEQAAAEQAAASQAAAAEPVPKDEYSYMTGWVVLDKNADAGQTLANIKAELPEGLDAYSSQTVSDFYSTYLDAGLSFVTAFLGIFAAIAFVIAIFLITNTFSILVTQQRREFALYRAIGATRGQVERTVLSEAAATGVAGAVLGIVLGTGLAFAITKAISASGVDLGGGVPTPSVQTVLAALVVGTVVKMLAAWIPAHRGGKIPPVAAMAGAEEIKPRRFGVMEAVLTAIFAVGAVALYLGASERVEHSTAAVGLGALLVLIGATGISAHLGWPLTKLLGRIFTRIFGAPARLADLNVHRYPRRTASTASALMIGLTLVTMLAMLGSSASATVDRLVRENLRGDYTVESVNHQPMAVGLPEKLGEVEGVAAVHEIRAVFTQDTEGQLVEVAGYKPEDFNKMVAQEIVDGRVMSTAEGEAIMRQSVAESRGVSVGDSVEVINPATRMPESLTIVGLYAQPEGLNPQGTLETNLATVERFGGARANVITVDAELGADQASVTSGLEKKIADYPMLVVSDQEEYAQAQTDRVGSILGVLCALLGLAIVIAVLGIVNTLVLSVIERTREIGLLRAVGTSRGQVRLMVTLEAVTISLLGAALGTGLGLVFGACLQRVLAGMGLTQLVIPWGMIGLALGGAVIVGVVAAALPSRRAARLDILDAIAHE